MVMCDECGAIVGFTLGLARVVRFLRVSLATYLVTCRCVRKGLAGVKAVGRLIWVQSVRMMLG